MEGVDWEVVLNGTEKERDDEKDIRKEEISKILGKKRFQKWKKS